MFFRRRAGVIATVSVMGARALRSWIAQAR
jgi:hypothetical protein